MADTLLVLMADISIWEGLHFLQSLAIQSSEPNRDSVSDESRCVGRFTFLRSRCPASIVYRAEGMICNLLTGGCAIRTMSFYHYGEEILLVLVLPDAGQVAICAVVRWISRPFVGVEFFRDQDQAKLAVGSYLDQLMQRKLAKGIAIY
jgi:Tfp pilus assembly protein PilZ